MAADVAPIATRPIVSPLAPKPMEVNVMETAALTRFAPAEMHNSLPNCILRLSNAIDVLLSGAVRKEIDANPIRDPRSGVP